MRVKCHTRCRCCRVTRDCRKPTCDEKITQCGGISNLCWMLDVPKMYVSKIEFNCLKVVEFNLALTAVGIETQL